MFELHNAWVALPWAAQCQMAGNGSKVGMFHVFRAMHSYLFAVFIGG